MLSFLLSSPPDLEPDARRAFLFLISGARQLFCFARSLAVDVFSTDMTNEQCITFRGGKLGAGTGAGGRGPGPEAEGTGEREGGEQPTAAAAQPWPFVKFECQAQEAITLPKGASPTSIR